MPSNPYQTKSQHLPPELAGKGKAGIGSHFGLSADDVEDFIYRGKVLNVSSSNVFAVQFLINQATMVVQYQDENGGPGQHYG